MDERICVHNDKITLQRRVNHSNSLEIEQFCLHYTKIITTNDSSAQQWFVPVSFCLEEFKESFFFLHLSFIKYLLKN